MLPNFWCISKLLGLQRVGMTGKGSCRVPRNTGWLGELLQKPLPVLGLAGWKKGKLAGKLSCTYIKQHLCGPLWLLHFSFPSFLYLL